MHCEDVRVGKLGNGLRTVGLQDSHDVFLFSGVGPDNLKADFFKPVAGDARGRGLRCGC